MSFRLHSTIVVLSTIIASLAPFFIPWLSPFAIAWLANIAVFEIATSFNVLGVYPWGLLVNVTCLCWPFISFMPAFLLNRFFPPRCRRHGCPGHPRLGQGQESMVYRCDVCGDVYDTHISFDE